ncbi:MAG: pyrophosphate--fructose 6-phosphate 1-phosphotransferase subunit beta [Chlamydiota bacterium]|jgi:pyrophosphate--fructose-6-phosphate 1-phosphotransferase
MDECASLLQKARRAFIPVGPSLLESQGIGWQQDCSIELPLKDSLLKSTFPHLVDSPLVKGVKTEASLLCSLKVGVLFSGGPAPGGHNVIAGLYDRLQGGVLLGFLEGASGLINGAYRLLDGEVVDRYRNTGGFDLLGSSRVKIESEQDLDLVLQGLEKLELDGLVVVGGDDSNTNAAVMAEHFLKRGSRIVVVGVPKTIDGDLKNEAVEIPFGFDTACKVYAELVGNIAKDALSSRKYYHFIRLMGRSASHIVLEAALQTQPNLAIISEEVADQKHTLSHLVKEIAELIVERHAEGKSYGVILVPEGIIEALADVQGLIRELGSLENGVQKRSFLSKPSLKTLSMMPQEIQQQLLFSSDPHGNVPVSAISSEKLLIDLVKEELKERNVPFAPMHHFLGYEARCAFPSFFDSCYAYALGKVACALIEGGKTGYMACLRGLHRSPTAWEVGAVPLVRLMHFEERGGKKKPVIAKALVKMDDPAFIAFCKKRASWRLNDNYRSVGPMQFAGDPALVNSIPQTMEK